MLGGVVPENLCTIKAMDSFLDSLGSSDMSVMFF